MRVISTAARPEREITTFFYDDRARVVKTHKENYLGGQTVTESLLDFSGKVLKKLTLHRRENTNSNEIRIDEQFEYSPQDRLLTHLHRVNDGNWEVLANNTYDELGQLISKKVGKQDPTGASFLQKVDYAYNIRGWLTNINNIADTADEVTDLFAFKINYNTREQSIPGVENLYNGNICETYWRTESDGFTRMYGYQYDDLNRLLKGNYRKMGYSVTGNYDETLSYDKHGNIQTLQRNGFADADFGTSVEIDNLVYAYDGNQLLAVQDMSNSLNGFRDNVNNGTPDYGYDAYGNMTSDANKRIEDIDYNHLNLPTVINFQNNSGRIRYTYDALGVKLRKEVDDINGTTTTDYLDGFQYKNEVLSFFPTSEGYVEFKEPARFFYIYNYTDHLGNVRMSYTDNGTAVPKILEENHYYPFGLKHENYASEIFERIKEPNGELFVIQPTERREWQYKYNGKEWQDELGLNFYDYGARNYDAAIGRWMNVDPLAEKMRRHSPFNYAFNNPMRFVDPDGMAPDDWRNKAGELIYNTDPNNGEIGYTKFATKKDREIGAMLQKTETGKQQFDKLVNSDIPITISVLEEAGPSKGTNEYKMGNTALSPNAAEAVKADIEVYVERIRDYKEAIQEYYDAGMQDLLNNEQKLYHEATLNVAIAANLGHEIEHAANPANRKLDNFSAEIEPEQIEEKILKRK